MIASVLIVVLDIRLAAVFQRLVVLLNAAKRYARVQLLWRQRVPVSSCFHQERVLKHLPLCSLFLLSLGSTSASVGIINDWHRDAFTVVFLISMSVHVHTPIYVDSPSTRHSLTVTSRYNDTLPNERTVRLVLEQHKLPMMGHLLNCTARLAGVMASMFVNKAGAATTSGLSKKGFVS